MTDGTPRSLIDQLAARLRAGVRPPPTAGHEPVQPGSDTVILAALLASVPFSIWAGAEWLTRDVRARSAALVEQTAPWRAARADQARARAEFTRLVAAPRAAERVDQLARALDESDRIAAVQRDAGGTITAEVLTVDPARVRSQLRRSADLPPLRTVAERRGEAALVVRVSSR